MDRVITSRWYSKRTYLYSCFHPVSQKSQGCASSPFPRSSVDPRIAEALAESTVKIAGRDVLATWKILISLGIAPLLYGFYAAIATLVAIKSNFSWTATFLTPVVTILSLPFMNFAALKFGEAGFDVLK